jgi:uncharacterized circularly permuted ATP-grasp superfamily protein
MKLKDWLRNARGKRPPEEVYVHLADAPAEPEGPYRARLAEATHQPAVVGIDVSEREVVRGELQVLYRTHCPCSHQWDTLHFHRMSICPKCGCAVLVNVPKLPFE